MPGFDGTGPLGLGPMTGGGMGYCVVPLSQTGSMTAPYAGYKGRRAVYPVTRPGFDSSYYLYRKYGFGVRFGRWFARGFGQGRGSGRGIGRRGWFWRW